MAGKFGGISAYDVAFPPVEILTMKYLKRMNVMIGKLFRLLVLSALAVNGLLGQSIFKDFENPPSECSPGVFWYWLNGRISSEGIDADLEAMKAAGIREVRIFNVAHLFTKPKHRAPFAVAAPFSC